MSDPPPTKPKPGSLKDRIAAFERKPETTQGNIPPPPRPKPGGLQWKPKQLSPSEPSNVNTNAPASSSSAAAGISVDNDNEGAHGDGHHSLGTPERVKAGNAGGMSASDAREAIGKAGSLKERMAALQGKGAFGGAGGSGPPPLAPKPALEKPKWKPPPVVRAPTPDEEDSRAVGKDEGAEQREGGRERERSVRSGSLGEEEEAVKEVGLGETSVEGGGQDGGGNVAAVDPAEEERQRRANIAARMAKLGGARVGMGPPVFGVKPPVPVKKASLRKGSVDGAGMATFVPVPAKSDDSPAERPSARLTETQTTEEPAVIKPDTDPTDTATTASLPPDRKSTSDSIDVTPSGTPTPSSMPVPAGPRRAAPPRKKAVKTPTPPSAQVLAVVDGEAPPVDVLPASEEAAQGKEEGAEELATKEADAEGVPAETQRPELEAVEDTPEYEHVKNQAEHEHEEKEKLGERTAEPELTREVREDVPEAVPASDTAGDEPAHAEVERAMELEEEHEHRGPAEENVEEAQQEEAGQDEAARRERIADKLEETRGLEPFAALPTPPRVPSESMLVEEPVGAGSAQGEEVGEAGTRKLSTGLAVEELAFDAAHVRERKPTGGSTEREAAIVLKEVEQEEDETPRGEVEEDSRQAQDSTDEQDDSEHSAVGLAYEDDADNELQSNANTPESSQGEVEDNAEDVIPAGARSNRPLLTRVLPSQPGLPLGRSIDASSSEPMPAFARIVPYLLDEEEQSARGSETEQITSLPVHHPKVIPYSARVRDDEEEGQGQESNGISPSLDRAARPVPPPRTRQADVDQKDEEEAGGTDERGLKLEDDEKLPVLYPVPQRAVPPNPAPPSDPSIPQIVPPRRSSPKREILDESEGDPIDPSFHSPSRRGSPSSSPTIQVKPTTTVIEPKGEEANKANEELAARRQKIADRIHKLGGIKFGAPAPPVRPPPPPAPNTAEDSGEIPTEQGGKAAEPELTEEGEERARKQRIAAKLAGMGGMRLGMLPGMPAPRRQQSKDTATSPPQPPPPTRAVPLARPPPLPSAAQPELESGDDSAAGTSDDGVKIEAEESEIEEVTHEEAEEQPEEIAPPVPVRGGRRQSIPTAHPPPRPAVPPPTKRQSTASRQGSLDAGTIRSPRGAFLSQAEYVMVEGPVGEPGTEESAPSPPPRPSNRAPPPRVATLPPSRGNETSPQSPWELPSIHSMPLDMSMISVGKGEGGEGAISLGTSTELSRSGWSEDSSVYPDSTQKSPPATVNAQPAPNQPQVTAQVAPADPTTDELMAIWGRVGVQICEVATTLFESSKKSLVGDGSFRGFVDAVLSEVPNALRPTPGSGAETPYGALIYSQTGSQVQKRVCEIMPGDVIFLQDAKLKGHKGLQSYTQNVGASVGAGGTGEPLVGVIGEFEPKKVKIRVFQANQQVGQQTAESVSYRLEDLKSGTVKVFRVLEA